MAVDAEVFVELTVRFRLQLAVAAGNPILINYMRDVVNRLAAAGIRTLGISAAMSPMERAEINTLYTELLGAVEVGSAIDPDLSSARNMETEPCVSEYPLAVWLDALIVAVLKPATCARPLNDML